MLPQSAARRTESTKHMNERQPAAMNGSEGRNVHYGPGNSPLCGEEDELAAHTDDPHQVVGCDDCLELVAEDLNDNNEYRGRCLHCGEQVSATGGVAWRRVVRRPCPHCGRPGW